MNINISIVSNIVVEHFIKRFLLKKEIMQTLDIQLNYIKLENLYNSDTTIVSTEKKEENYIVIMLKAEVMLYDLTYRFYSLTIEEKEEIINRFQNYISILIKKVRSLSNGIILFHSFEMPIYEINNISRYNEKKKVFIRLNNFLEEEIAKTEDTYLIDTDNCLRELGISNYYNYKYWYMANNPYSLYAYKKFFETYEQYIRIFLAKAKKCIVLDCDNVLWGGIVGEDGFDHIQIGKDYPGRAYYEVQNVLIELSQAGIILTLCSKNNESDVLNVFQNKKSMPLTLKYISAYRINWNEKAANIVEIAKELNIGLDSMVFIDDSIYEIGLVNQTLPEVSTILFPKDKPEDFIQLMRNCNFFNYQNNLNSSFNRAEFYQQNKKRIEYKLNFENIGQYYSSLGTTLKISIASQYDINRISELSFRTNQFNLSYIRYDINKIREVLSQKQYLILCLYAKDIFGDMGMIGNAVLKYVECGIIIENMMISCRALGRKIEELFLDKIVEFITKQKINKVVAYYKQSDKNEIVKNLFKYKGFYRERNNDLDFYIVDHDKYIYSQFSNIFNQVIEDYGGNVWY